MDNNLHEINSKLQELRVDVMHYSTQIMLPLWMIFITLVYIAFKLN